MPLHLAFSNDSSIAVEHLLFEGIVYRLGNSPQADIMLGKSRDNPFTASLYARAGDSQWILSFAADDSAAALQSLHHTKQINSAMSILIGGTLCRVSQLSLDEVAEHDRQYFKRRQQLRVLEKDLQNINDITTTIELARHFLLNSLHCDHAAVFFQADFTLLSPPAELPQIVSQSSLAVCSGLLAWSARSIRSVALESLHVNELCAEPDTFSDLQVLAAFCVPITIDGRVAGFLYGDNVQGRRYFSQTETLLVESMANMLSLQWLFHTIEQKISKAR